MAQDDQERTEQASEKRRLEYRKKGQVAQSREVHTAALFTASLILWYFYAPIFWEHLQELVAHLLELVGSFEVSPQSIMTLGISIASDVGLLLMPVLLTVLIVGFLSSVSQIGFLFTTKPLEFDLSKLNPISGMGRFFSKRSLVELVKSLSKVLLVGLVAYKAVSAQFERDILLVDMGPLQMLHFLGDVSFSVLLRTSGVLIVLALLDFMFVRWELEQKMKMTKQEQKEEFKESEGDPQLKGRIRAMQREMSRKRMIAEVPKADVVITNPTHLSVAIRYDRTGMDAPMVVAKGADHLAMRIREVAREHDVPLVENVPVARALYELELEQTIPEELFAAVAEILAYVYSLKGNIR